MDFEGIILNSGYKLHDLDAVKKYINLCSTQYTGDEYSELHHILPKSMFAEYANNKENLVRLKNIQTILKPISCYVIFLIHMG